MEPLLEHYKRVLTDLGKTEVVESGSEMEEEAESENANTVSYTHLTLPTIPDV